MYSPQTNSQLAKQSAEAMRARLHATRKPQRVTCTLPFSVMSELQELSLQEGRSLSNLIAHLLEASLQQRKAEQQNRN